MTIRPIDMQIIFPKSTEIAKIHQTPKQNADTSQSLLASQLDHQLQIAKQKVSKREKAEGAKIDKESPKDTRKDTGKRKGKKRHKKRKAFSEKIQKSRIDIKV